MAAVFERIYAVVRQIPAGKVSTYGMVAALAGSAKWARAVGYALHRNPNPAQIPCHRVVNRYGNPAPGYAFGGEGVQRAKLEAEGVRFLENGSVDLEHCLWNGIAEERP